MFRMLLLALLLFINPHFAWADVATQPPITLNVIEKKLLVNGKKSKVFDIVQPNNKRGFTGTKGEYFNIILNNNTSVPVSIHWHGLIVPNDQDGIPYVTQLPIQPHQSQNYCFKLLQAGTFWMHSHYKFHEQKLMAAPLIINDPQDKNKSNKDVTVMLQGFTFKDPEDIFYNLQHKPMQDINMAIKPDLNDVTFDAYIANRRTLRNPQIIHVHPGDKVRLRLINASSASNFWIDTGTLDATAIAVDGNSIKPIHNTLFQLAVAQRIDLMVTIPQSGGGFPILAQVEGKKQRAGVILVTRNGKIPHLSELAETEAPALDDAQEQELHAPKSFANRPIKKSLNYKLTGDMQRYIWKINDEIWPRIKPYKIKKGDRVEMVFTNDTDMAHPMHFHGHVFQVTEVDGKKLADGPMRDTILVLPHSTKKVIFDADNPGIWMTHCHVLYQMAAGMMTTTNYAGYPEPDFYRDLIGGKISLE